MIWLFWSYSIFFGNAVAGAKGFTMTAALKEQRRQDCARRHCRSYRGQVRQRQRFPARQEPDGIAFECR